VLGKFLKEKLSRRDDVSDYLSFIATTFPIQQQNTKSSWCSLQQWDGRASVAKLALISLENAYWIKHLLEKRYQ
jgi:hypothetical protein